MRLLDPHRVPHFAKILLVPGFIGPEPEESENKARLDNVRFLERNLDQFLVSRGRNGSTGT